MNKTSVDPKFLNFAKKYVEVMSKRTGKKYSQDFIINYAMYLAVNDDSIKTQQREREKEDYIKTGKTTKKISLGNSSKEVNVTNISNGNIDIKFTTKSSPLNLIIERVTTEKAELDDLFNNIEQLTIRKSPAFEKLKKEAEKNKAGFDKLLQTVGSGKKITPNNIDKLLVLFTQQIVNKKNIENRIKEMTQDVYLIFRETFGDAEADLWGWIDDNEMDKEWAEFQKEQNTKLGKERALFEERYLSDPGLTYEQAKKKIAETVVFKKTGVLNAVNINKNVDMELKTELNELKSVLAQEVSRKTKELLAEAKRESNKIAQQLGLKTRKAMENTITANLVNKSKVSKARKSIVAKSNLEIRGFDNLFNPEYETYVKDAKEIISPSGKVIKLPNYDMTRRIKETKVKIPKGLIRGYAETIFHAAVVAALFFQILVSNTPLDEDYEYMYEYKAIKRGRFKKHMTQPYVDSTKKRSRSANVRVLADELDVAGYVNKMEVITKRRKMKHKADKSIVRNEWELTFKGVTFISGDKQFEGLFDKKNDKNSVLKIARIFYENTKNSKLKSNSFTFNNTNPRWEMLEFGYYIKDSKARIGTPFGLKHGVTEHFSHQAPQGFVRLTEAKWEEYVSNGVHQSLILDLFEKDKFDVSEISKSFLDKLKTINPNLNLNKIDSENLFTGVYK